MSSRQPPTRKSRCKTWAARILLFLVLASDYVVLRNRPVVAESVLIESEETVVVEREREKERA